MMFPGYGFEVQELRGGKWELVISLVNGQDAQEMAETARNCGKQVRSSRLKKVMPAQ